MIDYKKLIADNDGEFNDYGELIDFVNNYINETGDNLKDLEDNIAEEADSLVPIYYNAIVEEWRENGDCHGATVEAIGEYGEKDIYKMMQSDLYFYYEQRLQEDYQKLLDLLEEQADETEELTEDLQREALTEAGIPEDEAERMIEDLKD